MRRFRALQSDAATGRPDKLVESRMKPGRVGCREERLCGRLEDSDYGFGPTNGIIGVESHLVPEPVAAASGNGWRECPPDRDVAFLDEVLDLAREER